jgi:CBS domain-containing protein
MNEFTSNLQRLLRPLTEGLRIRHIAHFGLCVCSGKDDRKKVLADPELAEYDHIPVTESGKIVGILERDLAKTESNVPRPLDEDVLISADEPLANFIHTVRDQPYRLVLDGTRIKGIVTRSDLLKAPVLLLGYSLLAQMELLTNRAMALKYKSSDDWLLVLEEMDQKESTKKIKSRKKKAESENLSIPTIEHADLIDKLRVIQDYLPKGCDFEVELNRLVKFRNIVDHVRQLVPSKAHLDGFVRSLEIIIQWTISIESNCLNQAGWPAGRP